MVEPRSITFVVICDRLAPKSGFFHLPEQRFGGDPPEFKRIDIHCGDRKLRHFRDLGIVKAQYTELFGNADAEFLRARSAASAILSSQQITASAQRRS